MRALLGVLCLALACGGEVEVVQDGPSGGGGSGASHGTGASSSGGCTRCGLADCGMCIHEGGPTVFACRGSGPPAIDLYCTQTGNLFHDAAGSYVCWRCK